MSELVESARKYMGVKFRHRGRSSTRLDCVGLAVRAYADCGVELKDYLLYGKEPHQDGLVSRIKEALGEPVQVAPVKRQLIRPGDILVMRYRVEPHHIAIATDYLYGGLAMIHADGHNKCVVEHRLTDDMVRRITHVFRRPV